MQLEKTYIGASSNIDTHANNARKFLLDNVNRITFNNDEETKLLNTHDPMVRTLMSELYQQALLEKKLSMFKLIILDRVDKVPSGFLISWLDIDTLILRDTDKATADVLNSFSEFRDKILVDVTQFYSEKRKMITDTTSLYERLVRAMLRRSYHKSGRMWLTPNIIYYLTKFYAIILSTKIGKIYNLTYQEQFVAATALAVFFVNSCSDTHEIINPVMGKMDFLKRQVDTEPIYNHIREKYTAETYDLKAVIETIVELGPSRMSSFNFSTFLQMNLSLTSNQLISLVSLEYPPYWCQLIIAALSGDKSSMYHNLKTLNLKRDTIEFQNELLRTSSFIRSL